MAYLPPNSRLRNPQGKVAELRLELNSGGKKDKNFTNKKIALKKIVAKGGDTSAFRRDPYPSILVNAFWKEDTPENVKRGRDIVYDIIAKIKTFNPDMSAEQQQGYGNYDDESLSKVGTDKAKLVFGKHYPRLQELKKKYDPDQVFHKWFPITPAP